MPLTYEQRVELLKKAREAKKNKKGAPGTQAHADSGSKIRGGQRSGGAPQVQRKAGPSGSGSAG